MTPPESTLTDVALEGGPRVRLPASTQGGDRGDRFRADVQGLRGVAVLLVILDHAKVPHFAGGYVGVDVFFVISGYVITGSLLRQRDGTIVKKLVGFYARRVRRIMPAATLTLLATLVASYAWLGAVTGRSLGTDERWASLFGANWRFIHVGTSYLLAQQPQSVILHYWSLAVEEQFYLVFPLIVFSIVAICSSRRRSLLLIACIAVGLAFSAWWSVHETSVNPVTAYYSPFTRVWELGLGAVVALVPFPRERGQKLAAAVGLVALAAVIAAAMQFNAHTAYPGYSAWWPVGASAVLLYAGKSDSRGTRPRRLSSGPSVLLARQPLVFVGNISYSLYLWHFPLLMIPMQYAVTGSISPIARVALVLVAFALATASYFFVENPVRRSAWLRRHTAMTFAMAVLLIASVWVTTGIYQHVVA